MPAPLTPHVPLIASIDVGTSSSRVIMFNKQGQEVAKHQVEYSTPHRTHPPDKAAHYTAEGLTVRESSLVEFEKDPGCDSSNSYSASGAPPRSSPRSSPDSLVDSGDSPTLSFPQPGWIQCNPINILSNVLKCLAATTNTLHELNSHRAKHDLAPYQVKCMGIANMRETIVVWSHSTGKLLADYAICWNDTRNLPLLNKHFAVPENKARLEELKRITGLPLDSTYFSCSKIRWLIDNEPRVREAYEKRDLVFGTVDTWLLHHLTDTRVLASDVTNASRTGFMNIHTLDYDKQLFEFWGLDMACFVLPDIRPSAYKFGNLSTSSPLVPASLPFIQDLRDFLTGHPSIPLQGCLGDQSASLVGQLSHKRRNAKVTYGTGAFLLLNTGQSPLFSQNGALTTLAYHFPNLSSTPTYALEGSIAVAGSAVQWLRDNLRLFPNAQDIGPMASSVPDTGGVVFIPSFNGLWSPYWDPHARASMFGVTLYTTANHIARAAVEGVCYQVRAILKAMSKDMLEEEDKTGVTEVATPPTSSDSQLLDDDNGIDLYESGTTSTLSADGGMSRSDEVMQIQANILGPCVKIRRSRISECTALGAAIAANFAFENVEDRVWKDWHDIKDWVYYNGKRKEFIEKKIAKSKEMSLSTTTNASTTGSKLDDDGNVNVTYFFSNSTDEQRRKNWKRWQVAIKRSTGWLQEVED
ncbi:hypothetical protein TBLA_0E01350 [Henningerozyma blattae CBS 6284]|uniref:glycerol kinase n=1 Tax=Henningerozyma blattae (strain ATCC 34711 / CBS 6284 / DSM 70876 / NBRC 10599 / NRRL Y-10934 / UCD 77-7) TaxID=1071380 RepID=I2H492_HENB6|nr:hypothetical protein TBLA_0E01350 [Tetrapisispora blattae CBS 6284]CCH61194.1 hypothetical protein TBLA_0E01350 [Tetrapisispora blattae CBS 6284]